MGFGEYVINGMRPSDWNAAKGKQAIQGISFEGNRPSARVTARRSGAAVTGQVTDCSGHPLAAQAVRLQRKAGNTWRAAGTGQTGAGGSYSLAARAAGVYRVVVGTRASSTVTVR